MNKRLLYIYFIIFLQFYMGSVWAGCSSYMGLATINEVSKEHPFFNNVNDFIEVKKLDKGFPASVISNWRLEICETIFTVFYSCSGPLSLSSANQTGKYWTLYGSPSPSSYIDWRGGFDVVLLDENDDVIDYLTVNNVTPQYEACDYPYPITASGSNSTRRTARFPDGVGDWVVPPGNSQPPTDGEDNIATPPPADAPSLGFLEDVVVTQGETALITFVLNTSYSSDVTINYATVNGSAIGSVDYQTQTGSLVIAAGQTSITTTVNTYLSGNVVDTNFFVVIESAVNADVVDQVAEVTIVQEKLPDHFSIQHTGQGVNCEPLEVMISAMDSNKNVMLDYTGNIQISTNTDHGDWSRVDANGSLILGSANSGLAQYNFVSQDNGQITLALYNTNIETTNINIIDNNGITENSNAGLPSDDEDIQFQQAIFYLLYDNGVTESQLFPDFKSHKPFNHGLARDPIKIRAITTDVNTGECKALFSGNQSVEFALECIDPINCDTSIKSNFILDGNVIPENNSGVTSFKNVILNFDGAGNARLTNVRYQDAGRVKLHVRKVLTASSVVGTSSAMDFLPAGFCLTMSDADDDCFGSTETQLANCSVFKTAGDYFTANITAQGWQADSDTNFCDNNAIPFSFNSALDISPILIAPVAGDLGYLNTSSTTLINGANSFDLSWSEVGVLGINMGGNNYLSSNLPISTSDNIGRFIPAAFRLTKKLEGSFLAANDTFSYIGQVLTSGNGAIGYLMPPQYEYVSLNSNAVPDILQNYIGEFNKNPQPLISTGSNVLGSDGVTPLTINAEFFPQMSTYNTSTDAYTVNFSDQDHFLYVRDENSFISPFIQDVVINLEQFTDDDGVNGQALSFNPMGSEVRYGRLRVLNAFGSETQAITQSIYSEYYDGQQFQFNDLDNHTLAEITNIVDLNVIDVGDSTNPLLVSDTHVTGLLYDTGPLQMGVWQFQWSSPIDGHYGEIQFTYAAPHWLTFNWDGSADNSQEDPKASVSFGQYKGHDKVIYWKELFYE